MTKIAVGDKVFVSGWGVGAVTQVGVPQQFVPEDWIIVQDTKPCECQCGHEHDKTVTKTANLMHVTRMS